MCDLFAHSWCAEKHQTKLSCNRPKTGHASGDYLECIEVPATEPRAPHQHSHHSQVCFSMHSTIAPGADHKRFDMQTYWVTSSSESTSLLRSRDDSCQCPWTGAVHGKLQQSEPAPSCRHSRHDECLGDQILQAAHLDMSVTCSENCTTLSRRPLTIACRCRAIPCTDQKRSSVRTPHKLHTHIFTAEHVPPRFMFSTAEHLFDKTDYQPKRLIFSVCTHLALQKLGLGIGLSSLDHIDLSGLGLLHSCHPAQSVQAVNDADSRLLVATTWRSTTSRTQCSIASRT